jgi:hypothetical protein
MRQTQKSAYWFIPTVLLNHSYATQKQAKLIYEIEGRIKVVLSGKSEGFHITRRRHKELPRE